MPRWAGKLGKIALAVGEIVADFVRARREPPMRIDDMHVGATTEGVREAERAKAEAKWPAPSRVPRELEMVHLDEPPAGGRFAGTRPPEGIN